MTFLKSPDSLTHPIYHAVFGTQAPHQEVCHAL